MARMLMAVILVGGVWVASAQAKGVQLTVEYNPAYNKCMAAPDATTASMLQCTDAEVKRWDSRLNAAYGKIMAMADLPAKLKTELRDAQRAWIAARDKVCTSNGDITAPGGTLASVVGDGCFLSMTAQRASDLEDLANPEQ